VPIIHTGNWEWRSGLADATPSGDCASSPMTCVSFWFGNVLDAFSWGFGYDGFSHLSLSEHAGSLSFTVPQSLLLDGVFTDSQDLPAGFRVRDDYHYALGTSGPPASGNFHLNMQFTALGIDEDIFDFGIPHVYDREFSGLGDDADINLLIFLSISGWEFVFTADSPAYPTGSGTNFRLTGSAPPKFYGVFDIIYYWWKLPEMTACGEKNTRSADGQHLIYAGDQPPTPDGVFGEYEHFDPDDPVDGYPQPVILNLAPDHGRAGTEIVIRGEGFGDGATVQFDGVDADSVVVVSQFEIHAVAPAHANGFSTVAVINTDGVSS
jgi:hypothetical protein